MKYTKERPRGTGLMFRIEFRIISFIMDLFKLNQVKLGSRTWMRRNTKPTPKG